jgi:hypothetical protein
MQPSKQKDKPVESPKPSTAALPGFKDRAEFEAHSKKLTQRIIDNLNKNVREGK